MLSNLLLRLKINAPGGDQSIRKNVIEKAKDLGVFWVPRNLVVEVKENLSFTHQNPRQEEECLFLAHTTQDKRNETLKDYMLFAIPNMLSRRLPEESRGK